MEWAFWSFVVRAGQFVWQLIPRSSLAHELQPETETAYERARHRWSVTTTWRNRQQRRIKIDAIRLLKPSGGAIRLQPPVMLINSDDDLDALRERYMGDAVTVMGLEDVYIAPGSETMIEFIFQPPDNWTGNQFVAVADVKVLSGKPQIIPVWIMPMLEYH